LSVPYTPRREYADDFEAEEPDDEAARDDSDIDDEVGPLPVG
jgi:hypothetical protein